MKPEKKSTDEDTHVFLSGLAHCCHNNIIY